MVICDQTTWVTNLSLYNVDKVFQVIAIGSNSQKALIIDSNV